MTHLIAFLAGAIFVYAIFTLLDIWPRECERPGGCDLCNIDGCDSEAEWYEELNRGYNKDRI